MPAWPVSLPQYFDAGSWNEEPPDLLLETPMDAGPPKVRRRFTAGVRPINGAMTLDVTQLATFEMFYETTLLGGAVPFDWVRPSSRAACVMQFKKKGVTYRDLEAGYTVVNMQMYVLP
jgi:hypothetical protein